MQFCFTMLNGKLSYPYGSSLEYMQYFNLAEKSETMLITSFYSIL